MWWQWCYEKFRGLEHDWVLTLGGSNTLFKGLHFFLPLVAPCLIMFV